MGTLGHVATQMRSPENVRRRSGAGARGGGALSRPVGAHAAARRHAMAAQFDLLAGMEDRHADDVANAAKRL